MKNVYNSRMKNFLTLISLNMLIFSAANGAIANCSNGQCEFSYSNHYTSAKTYCLETLNFEQVDTQFLSFTILKTGQECMVIESINKN